MTVEDQEVSDNLIVGLDYTLRLEDGEVIDSSEDRAPLEFVQGQGQIVPGLEQALYGMEVGDEKDVVVEPADGYGERNPDAVQIVPKEAFPEEVTPEPGMGVEARDSTGRTTLGTVSAVLPEGVEIDLNHPLAGETLHFHVKIADLREPTAADLGGGCGPCGGCSPASQGRR